jgi:heme o synthase
MSEASGQAPAFSDFVELTKPRLSLLSVLTALIGYAAVRESHTLLHLACVTVATVLAAGGVATLNQWIERDIDARMKRTADRPIPAGRIPTGSAFVLGALMCTASLMISYAGVNGLSALFTLLTIVAYLAFYTPAKRWSRWSTEIGAIAGATPPLIGWAGCEGRVSALGWILFGILFFWQIPHFMAISWMNRSDYAAVNFPMQSIRDTSGRWAAGWSVVNTLVLVALSLIPVFLRLDSPWYGAGALLCGGWFLWRAVGFLKPEGREATARRLFMASIAYLPLVLGALVLDRILFY